MTVTSFFNTYGPFLGAVIGSATPIVAVIIGYKMRKSHIRASTRQIIKIDLETTQLGLKERLKNFEKIEEDNPKKEVELKGFQPMASQVVFRGLVDQIAELTLKETYALASYYKALDILVQKKFTVGSCTEALRDTLELNKAAIKALNKNMKNIQSSKT